MLESSMQDGTASSSEGSREALEPRCDGPISHALVSGCMGGLGATLVGHPMETAKGRLQMGLRAWPGSVGGLYKGIASVG